jgi:predicted outer membrane protein
MTDNKDPIKVEFAPGCFDNFDGTQEELDQLIAEITALVQSGEMSDQSRELSEDDWDELPDEVKEQIARSFDEAYGEQKRNLQ